MISFLYSKDFSPTLSNNKQFPQLPVKMVKLFGAEVKYNLCVLCSISIIE